MQPPAWTPPAPQPTPAWQAPVPSPDPSPDPGDRVSVMDAIRFPFSDANWTNNLLVSTVYMLIPFVGSIANHGWHAEIHQRLARQHPSPIPRLEFSDLMHYMGRGIAPFFVTMIVVLPMILLTYGVIAVAVVLGAATGAAVNEPLVMVLVWGAVSLVGALLLALMGVAVHAAQVRAELSEDLGSSLSPAYLVRFLGKTWLTVLVSNLLFGMLSVVVFFVGYLMCIVGMYPAIALVTMAAVHLRWQFYRRYLARGGEPIGIKEPQQLPSEAAAAYHAAYAQYQQPMR